MVIHYSSNRKLIQQGNVPDRQEKNETIEVDPHLIWMSRTLKKLFKYVKTVGTMDKMVTR